MSNFSLTSEPAHRPLNKVDQLDGLQKDMLEALHADQVKQQINDAKLRAVKQRVEYDDFEKLVMGAHLRPIKPRSDTLDGICKAFDGFVLPKHEGTVQGPAPPPRSLAPVADAAAVPPPAKTSNEFSRVWKRQCKTHDVRLGYLRHLAPDTLPLLFRTELDAALFDGFVQTLGEACLAGGGVAVATESGAAPVPNVSDGNDDLNELDGINEVAGDADTGAISSSADSGPPPLLAWAARLLRGLARLNRFDLTLDFADKKTVSTIKELLVAMEAAKVDADDLAALRQVYAAE